MKNSGLKRAMAGALLATAGVSALAIASPGQAQGTAPTRSFNIPAQPLASALPVFGDQADLQIAADTALVEGLHTQGVSGTMAPAEALSRLLTGTGLTWRSITARSLKIERAPQVTEGTVQLGPVRVEGNGGDAASGNGGYSAPPQAVMSNLRPAYAGGQVATGARLGMLGNRDVMDTPFNQTAYTAQLLEDQQVRRIEDVLANDPSSTPAYSRGSDQQILRIRGFTITGGAIGLNGLYGLGNSYSSSSFVGAAERVEILRGPGNLLNGLVGTAIGGSINIVTKRAADDPLTRLTASFASKSQLGAQADIGRRFGGNNQFGVRFNGAYRDGNTAVDGQKNEDGSAVLGLDYRGQRMRLSADLGYESFTISPVIDYIELNSSFTSIPKAPHGSTNWLPSWLKTRNETRFGMVQGEFDIIDTLTAYAAFGVYRTTSLARGVTTPSIDSTGTFTVTPRGYNFEQNNKAGQIGLRGSFTTGPIEHEFNLNASKSKLVYEGIPYLTTGTAFSNNIYNPTSIADQSYALPPRGKSNDRKYTSVGIADTLSILDRRVQLSVGVRRQQVKAANFSVATGVQTLSYDEHAWSPAYALVVKPWRNVSLYANYIEALQQGTIVGSAYANAGQIFAPYTSKQYEAGIKADWRTLITTASLFRISQPSTISVPGTPLPTLALNGEVLNRGLEINTAGMLTSTLRLQGGVMFIDAEQKKTANGTFDGKKAIGMADVQLKLGAEWDTPFLPGLTVGGRLTRFGKTYIDNANTLELSGWTLFDANIRYKLETPWIKNATVRLNVENLFDKRYWQAIYLNRALMLAQPRTVLLSLSFDL